MAKMRTIDDVPASPVKDHALALARVYKDFGKSAAEQLYGDIVRNKNLTRGEASALAQYFRLAISEHEKNPAPRIGTAKPRRKSQITGKPPTKRLVKRRAENKVPGYFPNPSPKKPTTQAAMEKLLAHAKNDKAHKTAIDAVADVSRKMLMKNLDVLHKQAAVSYAQGVIAGVYAAGAVTKTEMQELRLELASLL